ncbi:MAG: 30S ribosomal protein S5 [bacterium]|nr:30S ribosomal protein S5 [bacterium]
MPRRERRERENPEDREWEDRTVDLARVTRVTGGGKHMRFRACILIGNKKGQFGYGLAKGLDVSMAISKATRQAKKHLYEIPIKNETIPHQAKAKFSAAVVLIKPAPQGTGVKAGGALRIIFELAGVPNVVGKILGSRNKFNNIKAAIEAIKMLKKN